MQKWLNRVSRNHSPWPSNARSASVASCHYSRNTPISYQVRGGHSPRFVHSGSNSAYASVIRKPIQTTIEWIRSNHLHTISSCSFPSPKSRRPHLWRVAIPYHHGEPAFEKISSHGRAHDAHSYEAVGDHFGSNLTTAHASLGYVLLSKLFSMWRLWRS